MNAAHDLARHASTRGLPALAESLATVGTITPAALPAPSLPLLDQLRVRRVTPADLATLMAQCGGVERAILAADGLQQLLFTNDEALTLAELRQAAAPAWPWLDPTMHGRAFALASLAANDDALDAALAALPEAKLLLGSIGIAPGDQPALAGTVLGDPAVAAAFGEVSRLAVSTFSLTKLSSLASFAATLQLRRRGQLGALITLAEIAGDLGQFGGAGEALIALADRVGASAPARLYVRGRALRGASSKEELRGFIDDATSCLKRDFKLALGDKRRLERLDGTTQAEGSDFELATNLVFAIADARLMLGQIGDETALLGTALERRPVWKYGYRTLLAVLAATRGDEGIPQLNRWLHGAVEIFGVDFQLYERFLRHVDEGSAWWAQIRGELLAQLAAQPSSRECWFAVARVLDPAKLAVFLDEVSARVVAQVDG